MHQLDETEFDAIVLGTGLVESIAAAALARAGLKVLHLDRNDYYGAQWTSFNYADCKRWVETETEDAAHLYRHRQQHVTASDDALLRLSRQFTLELAPKLLLSHGTMVDSLISSDIGKYLEFRLLDAILLYTDALHLIPSSKEAVFSSPALSLIDKRKLMKYLKFSADYEDIASLDGCEQQPYTAWLTERFGLDARLAAAVAHAVTVKSPLVATVTVQEGIVATRDYLRSFGRYGPASLLCPVYGVNELVQAFCRVCAVFGGTYLLGQSVERWVTTVDEHGSTVSGVVLKNGQQISCKHLITSADYLPDELQAVLQRGQSVQRMICILDGPIHSLASKSATIVRPASNGGSEHASCSHPIAALQLGADTNACPEGYAMLYLWSEGSRDTLHAFARELLLLGSDSNVESGDAPTETPKKPTALYTVNYETCARLATTLPRNVHLGGDPNGALLCDDAIQQAQEIFTRILPDAPFLPQPERDPNTDDVDLGM